MRDVLGVYQLVADVYIWLTSASSSYRELPYISFCPGIQATIGLKINDKNDRYIWEQRGVLFFHAGTFISAVI